MRMIPNTSKYAPPVSHYMPLISSIPPRMLSRRLGVRPGWPRTEALSRRGYRAPVEVGLFHFLNWLFALPVTWPLVPAKGLTWLVESVGQQADEDQDMEKRLEEEKLSLKLTREMGEISGQ